MANPLTGLFQKGVSFKWASACQFDFEALKTLLCSTPVLSAPRFDRAFKLEIDASGTGAGAVLIQVDDAGIKHPISFFPRKFLKHQLNYITIEKETLALLLAIQNFEVYIGSSVQPITVYTYHNSLFFL